MEIVKGDRINRLNISLEIKKLREEIHVSQLQFYHDTGINVGRIETGKVDIKLETLRRICSYLHISLSEFFIKSCGLFNNPTNKLNQYHD